MKLPEEYGHIRGICRGPYEGKSREDTEREPGCAGRQIMWNPPSATLMDFRRQTEEKRDVCKTAEPVRECCIFF